MRKTLQRSRQISDLCKQYGIKHIVLPYGKRGHGRVREKILYFPELTDEMSYLVALHEIGHVVVGLNEIKLEREADAWAWALSNSLDPPGFECRQRLCADLYRHMIEAQRDKLPMPPKNHVFWKLLRWWET